jgi:hypothetical protein
MATFRQLPSGNWRVQIRRKGSYLSSTFRRRRDGEEWALDSERKIDRGETPTTKAQIDPETFGHLIELHLQDMREVGKAPRRSKSFSLDALNKKLGKVRWQNLTRERLIQFGKDRAQEGAGGVTIGIEKIRGTSAETIKKFHCSTSRALTPGEFLKSKSAAHVER